MPSASQQWHEMGQEGTQTPDPLAGAEKPDGLPGFLGALAT